VHSPGAITPGEERKGSMREVARARVTFLNAMNKWVICKKHKYVANNGHTKLDRCKKCWKPRPVIEDKGPKPETKEERFYRKMIKWM